MINWKKVRYAYWLTTAFFKKNSQSIIISFVASIIAIISLISFSPYLLKTLTTQKHVLGIAGSYSLDTLPDSVLSKISNGMVFVNEKGQVVPLLADSWEELKNGQEFRFHIKKDLLWNDGLPFIAKDINYSFKDVTTVVEGDHMIIYKLKKPLPIFPIYLTKPLIKYPLTGVGGLYRIEKIKLKYGLVNELELTPNKANLPILIYRFFDNEVKLLNAYKLGEIEEMTVSKNTVASNFSSWKNTVVSKTIDYTQVMALFFNLSDKLLGSDKDIRKAFANAINVDEFKDLGDRAYGPIPPTSWVYDENLKRIPYDPDKAEKTFKKAIESTESATLTIDTYYDYLNVAESIKNSLNKVGLNTQVEVLSGGLPQNFVLLLTTLQLSNDPDQYFYWHSTQHVGNITNYKNVKIDKLLEDGRNTLDPEKRKEIYLSFQKTIVDELPAYFLYYPYVYTIKRK